MASQSTYDGRSQPWKLMGRVAPSPQHENQAFRSEGQKAKVDAEGSKGGHVGEHPLKHLFFR